MRSRWNLELATYEDLNPTTGSKTAVMYPVEYGNEESDGYCGNPSCGVLLAKGLSREGLATKLSTPNSMVIVCPKCLSQNLVPRKKG